jgi:membrane associated rhomboid family serine protease
MRSSQYTYRRSSFFSYFPSGVKWLLISNTAIFILTTLFGRAFADDIRLLELAPVAVVYHFCIYQLFTYMFLHAGITHLLFNMLTVIRR